MPFSFLREEIGELMENFVPSLLDDVSGNGVISFFLSFFS